ncbi:MAG TPA: hypothetical protein EYP61_04255 [Candidatus Latescibacteria bacterium]|nr:hypothetical protein [Candidatus Latescibacterota bacterium]
MILKIRIGEVEATVELLECEVAGKLWEVAPFESSAKTWGDEVYFSTPVEAGLEDEFAREVVEVGDVGYWPPGKALCLFFGPTPISRAGEIRPASTVVLVGRISSDPGDLRKVRDGDPIRVERG